MEGAWAVAAGAVLLMVATLDAVWTTITASHGGPLTRRTAGMFWSFVLWLHTLRSSHRLLQVGGVLVVLGTLASWVVLLWVGWALLFHGEVAAVLHGTTGLPASSLERVYFAGYTIFTLGNGDFVPGRGPWQLLTAAAAFHGLSLITMGVTYLVPLARADLQKRSFSSLLAGLGASPSGMLLRSWNGRGFPAFDRLLPTLVVQLGEHVQRHLAYPVLHYLHGSRPDRAAVVAIARLHDAVWLLRHGVLAPVRPDDVLLDSLLRSIREYVEVTSQLIPLRPAATPPAPSLGALAAAGVPCVESLDLAAAHLGVVERRRTLHRLVVTDGWTWENVGETA